MVVLKNFYTSNITKKYLKWLKDKDVTKHTTISSKLTNKEIKKYIKEHQNNKFQKLYRIFYLNKHVGNIRTSFLNNTEITVGIIIGEKKVYNLGIGTQALKKLINLLKKEKVKSIIAYVAKKNVNSVFFFKKNGFYLINKKSYFLKIKRNLYFIFKLDI